MADYSKMTQEDFDRLLGAVMDEDGPASNLLTIPGIYEVVSEHYNNDVLDRWGKETIKTLGDLAELVRTEERRQAPGSETCLLTAFVADHGYLSEIDDDDDTEITAEEYDAWKDAYKLHEQWAAEGREFIAGDLF